MKKMYTLLVAAILFTTTFAQSYLQANNVSDVYLNNDNNKEVNLISNPVKGQINIRLNNPNNTKYDISLYSMQGQKVTSVAYNHPGGVSTETMYVPQGVSGMYYVVVRSTDHQKSLKVFIEQ